VKQDLEIIISLTQDDEINHDKERESSRIGRERRRWLDCYSFSLNIVL